MVYAGLVTAQELANAIDPAELIVQYCFADQEAIDCRLTVGCRCWSLFSQHYQKTYLPAYFQMLLV